MSEIAVEREMAALASRSLAAGSAPFFLARAPIGVTSRRASII